MLLFDNICLFIKNSSVSQSSCFACLHIAYIHICLCYNVSYKYTLYQHKELKKHSSGEKKTVERCCCACKRPAASQDKGRRGQCIIKVTCPSASYCTSITKLHCIDTRHVLHVQNLSATLTKCKRQLSTLGHQACRCSLSSVFFV